MTTIATAANAQTVAAETAGHWAKARKIASDIPGVSFLSFRVPVLLGEALISCRVEVYSETDASVIIGGVAVGLTPTAEMAAEFTRRGCKSILAA